MKDKYLVDGKAIANNIRAERNRSRLSQHETADYLNVTDKTYISYEDNAENVKATVLYKLSLLFNCNITAFYLPNKSTKCGK